MTALHPAGAAALRVGARWRRSLGIPGAVLVALGVIALLAPIIAPWAADALDLANRRAAPSLAHWLGTDELGRDLFSRILYGARVSLAVGFTSGALCAAIGVSVGAVAGYAGRWIDDALMRLTDALLSVPRLPLLMIAAVVLQPGMPLLVMLVAGAGWMETARVVRAEVQSLRARDFVVAARSLGARPTLVLWRHVLPAVVPVAAVATTIAVGRSILLESALSFFGVGVQPPTASWGNMLYQGQTTMATEPWLAIFPGACIFLTVLALNALGDKLALRKSQ